MLTSCIELYLPNWKYVSHFRSFAPAVTPSTRPFRKRRNKEMSKRVSYRYLITVCQSPFSDAPTNTDESKCAEDYVARVREIHAAMMVSGIGALSGKENTLKLHNAFTATHTSTIRAHCCRATISLWKNLSYLLISPVGLHRKSRTALSIGSSMFFEGKSTMHTGPQKTKWALTSDCRDVCHHVLIEQCIHSTILRVHLEKMRK